MRVFPRGRIHKVFGANGVRSAVPKIKKKRKLANRTPGVEWVSPPIYSPTKVLPEILLSWTPWRTGLMYSIQNDEPKSFWQKLKFKQIAALRRRVLRGGLICVSVIAVHSVFNSPTEKVRVKPPDEWCWKEGVWWECQEVDGKQVKDTLEPSPRPDCHGGIESWGICSRGRFLCRSDATRWQWPTNEDDASKNYNIKMVSEDTKVQKPPGCVLFGGQFLCKDAFNLHGLRCLDNATSAGICSGSEVLCCRAEECPLGSLFFFALLCKPGLLFCLD